MLREHLQGSEQILYGFNEARLKPHSSGKISGKNARALSYLFLLAFLVLAFKPAAAQQPAVTLAWSPNTEPYLSHYVMYRDTIPGTMKYLDLIPKTDTTYVDTNVVAGKTYYYKLTAADSNGYESECSNEVSTTVGIITLNDDKENNTIRDFGLFQNYPNPFNPTTTIPYAVARNSKVTITIYDLLGKEIKKLVDEFKPAGNHVTIWDGKNNNGGRVSSGTYFYQMTAENYMEAKKLILQK